MYCSSCSLFRFAGIAVGIPGIKIFSSSEVAHLLRFFFRPLSCWSPFSVALSSTAFPNAAMQTSTQHTSYGKTLDKRHKQEPIVKLLQKLCCKFRLQKQFRTFSVVLFKFIMTLLLKSILTLSTAGTCPACTAYVRTSPKYEDFEVYI